MVDIDICFKIKDAYKNFIEKKGLGISVINELLKKYNLDPCDENGFIVVIEKLELKQKKIVIPKQIGEKKIPVEPGEYFNLIEDNIKYKTERLYKDLTEKEVQELLEKENRLDSEILFLSEMLNITQFYTSSVGESNNKKKRDRDTSSKKPQFIRLYLKNSVECEMELNKDIAELTKVSKSTVTRYINNIEILEELYKGLSKLYKTSSNEKRNLENDDIIEQLENIGINLIYIERRKKKLIDEKNIKDHLKSSAIERNLK